MAREYPLLKDYDFTRLFYRAGCGLLFVPREQGFVSREYGFGELRLMPYLQNLFESNRQFRVSNLEELMIKDDRLFSSIITHEIPFYNSVLKKLHRHGIVILSEARRKLDPKDKIKKGCYDHVRIGSLRYFDELPHGGGGAGNNM